MRKERAKVRWKSSKGANLVETAMVIPLLLLLTFAVVDFATLFYVYLALENGVSSATRYAVTGQFANDPDPTVRAQAIRTCHASGYADANHQRRRLQFLQRYEGGLGNGRPE